MTQGLFNSNRNDGLLAPWCAPVPTLYLAGDLKLGGFHATKSGFCNKDLFCTCLFLCLCQLLWLFLDFSVGVPGCPRAESAISQLLLKRLAFFGSSCLSGCVLGGLWGSIGGPHASFAISEPILFRRVASLGACFRPGFVN